MLTTLFHIPSRIGGDAGVPLFGWGLLLAVWALVGGGAFAWSAWRHSPAAAVRTLGLPLVLVGAVILWVLPALDDGAGVPVRGYGVMLLLAASCGTWLSIHRGRRMGFDADTILSLATEVFLWGLAGARLFYVIEYHDQFFRPGLSPAETLLGVVNVAAGGLVVFGAIPTAAVATWLFARRRRLDLLRLADCIAPGLLVGLAIGRVGCFFNGCCFGGRCDLPWAVSFPPGSPPWLDQVERGLLPGVPASQPLASAARSLPVHPVQIYAAIDAGLLAWLASAATPVFRRDGAVFAMVLTLHPISRILQEAIRVDEPPALGTPLSISQLISVGLLVVAAGLWAWILRRTTRGSFDSGSPVGEDLG